jgi:hypothetical protein
MSQTKEDWLRSGKNPIVEVGSSVAEEAAISAGAALATDLLFQTPPMRNTHPQLEGPLRVVVETTIVEMYDAQKALRDPSVLLGKFLDRYFEIVEIYQSTVILASTQKQALISAVLATETAAFAAADIGGMRGAKILRDALAYQQLAPISQAIGTDDEEAVNGILSVGLQALYAYYRGDRVLARQHAEKVRQLGNAGANIHPFSAITKPLDWAVTVINMGQDSPQIAAELFLGATSLANLYDSPSVEETGPKQILYSSLGEAEVYEKYEEVFTEAKVDRLVASVSPLNSPAVSAKFLLAMARVYGADIRKLDPTLSLAVAIQEEAMAFAKGLTQEEQLQIVILSSLKQLAFENGLTVEDIQLLNNGRNINQSEIHSFIPKFEDIDGTPGWILRPEHESVFHAFGYDLANIRKYTHGAGCEYVFRRTKEGWEFLNDGVNTGTFNYSDGVFAHTLLDIFPWILWGVGAEERRSFEERLRLAQENGLRSQIVERIKAVFSKDSSAVPSGVDSNACGSRPGEPDIVWRSDDPQSPDQPLDPNILFVQAVARYRDALSMEGQEQLAALADVRKRFDLIIENFPETRQAQAIQARSVPSVDFALLAVSEDATAASSFDIGVEAGLYSIDPALCSVTDTVGEAWGALFQSVSASSVSRGYERDCSLISVSSAGETVSVSAECSAEGLTEPETWTWRRTSQASFEEIEGRHSGKSYSLCASANPPTADAVVPAPAMSGKWGPSIVPDPSIDLGYRPCGDRADVRTCLEEKSLSKDAIDFSLATPMPGEMFAISFRELGAVDLVVASTPYAPYEAWFLVDGGPKIYEPEVTRGLSVAFVDAASQSMLRQFPGAQNFYSPIAAHRMLADGTQRFVLIETVTNQCRACDILGIAVTFLEVGPSTGGQLRRLPIGLSLDGPNNNAEISAGQLIGRPARLQAMLNSLGYDAGPMDGYPGPQTRTALMEFQVEHCLPPTGQPDPTTAQALMEANGFEAPCADSDIPEGISANAPLLAGIYVDDLALCMLEEIPSETVHFRQRIVRGTGIIWGQEVGCEMARTDIRDGITHFRGTCMEGDSAQQVQWRFDVLSNESFVDLDMLTSGSPVTPKTFSRCPADSPLRQAWSSWFGQDQLVTQGQMDQSKNEAFFEPARGSELWTVILDAVRPIAEEAYGAPVQFVVGTLRVGNDLADMGGTVQRPGGEAIDIAGTPAFQRGQIDFISGDPNLIDALLRRDGSGWKVIRHVLGPSEAWWLDDCATWGMLFPETCPTADLPEAATQTGVLPVTQLSENSPAAQNGQSKSVALSEFEALRSLIKFDGDKLRVDAEFDNCVITTYYFSGFGTLFDHLGGGFGYDAEVAIIDAKSIDLEKSIATPSRYVERVALTSVRGSAIDYLPIYESAMAGKTTRLDRREDFIQHFKENFLPRSRKLPSFMEWRSERQLDVLLIADDFVPDRQEINEAFFNVIRACQVEQTANTVPKAAAPEPAKSALAGGEQVEAVDDAVAAKPVIQFSDNSPATLNGQPMSVAVQTYRDPQALAILTKNGLIDASALPNPPRLASQDPAPTGIDRNVMDRPAALAMLRSEVFGGLYVEKVGSRTIRVREQDLSAFTEALITAIFSDDPRVREAQIDGLAPIREFGRSADFDSNFVEQLRFGLDYGQRFIGLWQSGTASLPNQVWRIMDVGVPTYQPHPKLDPNGTLIAQIGVADVSGIFVTGVTAEAQFTLKPLDDVRPALAEAARLKLRPVSMIEYPSGGSRKTSGFDLTSENATRTAYFRLYDDGWRLWNVR